MDHREVEVERFKSNGEIADETQLDAPAPPGNLCWSLTGSGSAFCLRTGPTPWFWALEALVVYMRAASDRSGIPAADLCARIAHRRGIELSLT